MGIFAGTMQGIAGGIFQMISHGLVSGALFLCVGVVYDRMHTREIAAYGGLVNRMPLYAAVFMVFTLANVGLPGTTGFIGEFLSLIGTFKVNTWVATLAALGLITSACYALWLYRQGDFWQDRKAVARPHPRFERARDHHLRAAADLDHPVRHLSKAGARHVGCFGRRRCWRTTSTRSPASRPGTPPRQKQVCQWVRPA